MLEMDEIIDFSSVGKGKEFLQNMELSSENLGELFNFKKHKDNISLISRDRETLMLNYMKPQKKYLAI